MKRAKDVALRTQWVRVDELMPARFHADLFPLPRDLSGLRRSFERHGYRPEYPIVARTAPGAAGGFEIVCGVGRHAVARERGMLKVPVVVRQFDSDDEARAYAIEDNLFGPAVSSRPSLAHMIVLARALKECGGECTPQQVWEAAGVSPSTYWRADGSVVRSIGRILTAHPGLQGLGVVRQVSEIIRKSLDPRLTDLLAGGVEVNTYHQERGRRERHGRRAEAGAGRLGKGGKRGRAPLGVSTESSKPGGEAVTAAKTPKGKKATKEEPNLSLFDMLPR
jgi:hypothetical protein